MLSNIRIVLVETSHPGNIGAVARAMKNFNFSQLSLVSPHDFPHAQATARAAGADHILCGATISSTLAEAIDDCHLVIGTSARSRTIPWPELQPRDCAELVSKESMTGTIALVFGREHSGLTNAELERCNYLVKIPTNAEFSSLNVAAAVLVLAYELYLTCQSQPNEIIEVQEFATAGQLELFFQHFNQTMCDVEFIHPDKSRSIMRRLRRLFNRARLEKKEVDILRGILSAAQNKKKRNFSDRN